MTMKTIRKRVLPRQCRLFIALAVFLVSPAVQATCRWQGGVGLTDECKLEDCPEDGGYATCKEPDPAPPNGDPWSRADAEGFQYHMCDGAFGSVANERVWCESAGGLWGGPTACDNLPVVVIGGGGTVVKAEGAATTISTEYVRRWTGACDSPSVKDSGWGAGKVDPWSCWADWHIVRNRYILDDHKSLHFDFHTRAGDSSCTVPGSGEVYVRRIRDLACPKPYIRRTKYNGDLQCILLASPMCPQIGNPTIPSLGTKVQEEVDYRADGPGALRFVRTYHSLGFKREAFGAAAPGSDYWVNNYDRRLFLVTGNPYLLAEAVRPDGTVKSFDSNGKEMQNRTGAADVLAPATSPAGWTLTLADSSVERYNSVGKLQSIRTREGLTTSLSYDLSGRLNQVTDAFGRQLVLTYNKDGQLWMVATPDKQKIVYAYDINGRLASVTYPGSRVRTYHYEDPRNVLLLTGITDEASQRFATYKYYDDGRVQSTEHAGGANKHTFIYHGNSTDVIDAIGTARVYGFVNANGVLKMGSQSQPCVTCGTVYQNATYDTNGNIASSTDFNGNRTNYVYDLARNLETSRTEGLTAGGGTTPMTRTVATQWHSVYRVPLKITEPSGISGVDRITNFTYDSRGNLLTKTVNAGALSRNWTYTVDKLGRVLTLNGPRTDVNDVTEYTYYSETDVCLGCRGQIRTVTDALSHVTTYQTYDTNGRPTRLSDANGVATVYAYDSSGRLTSRIAAIATRAAETTAFAYDAVGQVARVTLPDDSYLDYGYDAAHRLTDITNRAGDRTHFTLDVMGNRVREDTYDSSGQMRRTRSRVYDSLSRLSKELGAYRQVTQFEDDANGNQIGTLDPQGGLATSKYDALNRLIASTDATAATTKYGYDAQSNLASVTDADGLTTQYTYDGLGNLIQLDSPDTGATRYAYDAASNRTSQTDARGITTTYTYDALNRLTKAVYGSGASAVTVSYTYDTGTNGIGRMSSITGGGSTLTYSYDAHGRVISQTETIGGTTRSLSYGYQNGKLSTLKLPSGAVVAYNYDNAGRVQTAMVDGTTLLDSARYQPSGGLEQFQLAGGTTVRRIRDADGRIVQLSLGPGTAASTANDSDYTYDAVDRLVEAHYGTHAQTFVYAPVGDRLQSSVDGAMTSYGYAAATHHLTARTGTSPATYMYDATGNVTARGGTTYSYDARNRMTAIGGSASANYLLNGRGERVQKTVGATATTFVYDNNGRLLGEYTGTTLVQEYVYLDDLLVAVLKPKTGSGVTPYPIYADHLGSPRAVTGSTGTVVWKWNLFASAFGENAPDEDPDKDGKKFVLNLRYPGQYFDSETGLHYNYFRDYEPMTGRYVESDPIGLRAGANTYAYVSLSPLIGIDPLGLDEKNSVICGPNGTFVARTNGSYSNTCGADQCLQAHEECHKKDFRRFPDATAFCAKPQNAGKPVEILYDEKQQTELHCARAEVECLSKQTGNCSQALAPRKKVIGDQCDKCAVDKYQCEFQ